MIRRVPQMLVLATLFLLISSLATVAVPKLVGQLIDTCINFHRTAGGEREAKRTLNSAFLLTRHCTSAKRTTSAEVNLRHGAEILTKILILLGIGGLATGLRSWCGLPLALRHRYAETEKLGLLARARYYKGFSLQDVQLCSGKSDVEGEDEAFQQAKQARDRLFRLCEDRGADEQAVRGLRPCWHRLTSAERKFAPPPALLQWALCRTRG